MSTVLTPVSSPSGSPGLAARQNATQTTLVSLFHDRRRVAAWLSVTPNWLRAAIAGIALLAVIFALAIRSAANQQLQTIQTIGKDSAPSIVAGQEMRANLADMHSNLVNELLLDPGQGTEAVKLFNERLGKGAEALLNAARNITYPGEVQPVQTVIKELPRYMEHAGRSRVLHEQGKEQFVAEHKAADEIMEETILPAIEKLAAVNQEELNKAYAAEKAAATAAWLLVLLTGAALMAAIIGLKILLYRRMRRVLNPPLALAAALAVCACFWALVSLWWASALIKEAKEDAFDSIKVLQAARAVAYDANGDESRWLLVKIHKSDPRQVQLYADAFHDKAKMIADYRGSSTDAELRVEIGRTKKGPVGLAKSYLATELNNITFPKELEAAAESLLTFRDYVRIDRQIRDLMEENKVEAAVKLCIGNDRGQSNWAFDQFDKALQKTIDINNKHFLPSLQAATTRLTGLDWPLPLGLAFFVSLLGFLGLRPRLREYTIG